MSAVTSNSTRPSHRCAASSGSSSSSHCRITPPQIPYRPHAPRSRAPVSSHSARARSSARSMSTSHAARVAASAPARTHEVNGLGLQWPFGSLGLEIWSGAARLHYWSGASGVSMVALPALAPQHGTVERSMRLESDVMAPACHQKKIPPPGNTSRAGALITIAVAELARSPGVRCKSQHKTTLRSLRYAT